MGETKERQISLSALVQGERERGGGEGETGNVIFLPHVAAMRIPTDRPADRPTDRLVHVCVAPPPPSHHPILGVASGLEHASYVAALLRLLGADRREGRACVCVSVCVKETEKEGVRGQCSAGQGRADWG